ncbi:MAG: hypothetical protein P1V20_17410 [Verrucomicrobiales bacterium]|nr:hypothetical protein [Verrucomicrobiales bacterium]
MKRKQFLPCSPPVPENFENWPEPMKRRYLSSREAETGFTEESVRLLPGHLSAPQSHRGEARRTLGFG